MIQYHTPCKSLLGIKSEPNPHEIGLFKKAQKYIRKLTWIPGIEMIAVCNSLSMYATHEDSDIDLCIITSPQMIWFVRVLVTMTLWLHGVWRHGEDIREHFCLSFFLTTDALDLREIMIHDDIYLYFWIYYLKPIYMRGDIYPRFCRANDWVTIPSGQKSSNLSYHIPIGTKKQVPSFYRLINRCLRSLLLPRTRAKYAALGHPEGVIISDTMLKFHDKDKRAWIRDTILEKNFDK